MCLNGYYFKNVFKWLLFKKKDKKCVCEDVEKRENFYTASRLGNWCNHYGKSTVVPQKIKTRATI